MDTHKQRLKKLRKTLKKLGVDGFIQPYRNRFQAHFLQPHDERIRYLCGFEGSAGFVAVTQDKAAVFYDQRYAVAVKKQVDAGLFNAVDYHETMPMDWLADKAETIAVDGWLHCVRDVEKLRDKADLVLLDHNPIDAIWDDRPPPAKQPASIHPIDIAGQSSTVKRANLAGEWPILITAMDSIGWLLNIRGGDVPYMPALEAAVILYPDASVNLFCDADKITDELRAHLGEDVTMPPFASLEETLATLPKIILDETQCPAALLPHIADYDHAEDPCLLPKACKNQAEQHALRTAHQRDGLALTRFLIWLAQQDHDGSLSELDISARLDAFRAENAEYQGHSFPNIVGFGAHSASIHTILNTETNQIIDRPGMILIDSGGQYPDGTTDVTRTTCFGTPDTRIRRAYTLVLKGHIALSSAIFPKTASGAQIDTLARQFLWQDGKDYAHGTGHGVGLYGDVHEGPCGISPRVSRTFEPGMLLSIEPGYYQPGDFGIRIENLALVEEAEQDGYYRFAPVTLAPIDTRLIDTAMLNNFECGWLNDYHKTVYDTHAPLLSSAERDSLAAMTAPISS